VEAQFLRSFGFLWRRINTQKFSFSSFYQNGGNFWERVSSTNVTRRAKRDQLGEVLIFQESEKTKKKTKKLDFLRIFLYYRLFSTMF